MKKIITVLLAILVIGSFGLEAKTTKKSGKKKSTTSRVVSNKIDNILKNIPSFNTILNTENQTVLFQNLGYDVSSKTIKNELYDVLDDEDYYVTLIIATKHFEDDGLVIYEQDICGNFIITIKRMPEVLEKYYKETKSQVKQFNRKYGDDIFYITAKKQGDKIITNIPCN